MFFGPQGPTPCLVVKPDRDGISDRLAAWLVGLPCLVVALAGAGGEKVSGNLSKAADVIVDKASDCTLIVDTVSEFPMASLVLAQHLRLIENLDFEDALTAESLAYALLQGGDEFRRWLSKREKPSPIRPAMLPVRMEREGTRLNLTLNTPDRHNEIDVPMRDALCEVLEMADMDRTVGEITLSAEGKCFSVGGALSEFGSVPDPATAHWIRGIRLPARHLARLVWRADDPVILQTHLNGPAIGAGLEMAAFSNVLTARSNAWLQLPEISMGLMPGAGGTVSVSRRIGRHKTAFMALTGRRIRPATALGWGLVDAVVDD